MSKSSNSSRFFVAAVILGLILAVNSAILLAATAPGIVMVHNYADRPISQLSIAAGPVVLETESAIEAEQSQTWTLRAETDTEFVVSGQLADGTPIEAAVGYTTGGDSATHNFKIDDCGQVNYSSHPTRWTLRRFLYLR